jgi:hypothetical protein
VCVGTRRFDAVGPAQHGCANPKAIGIMPSFNFRARLCEICEVRNRLQVSAALGFPGNCPAVFSDEVVRDERDDWNAEHGLPRSVAQK